MVWVLNTHQVSKENRVQMSQYVILPIHNQDKRKDEVVGRLVSTLKGLRA